MIENGTNQFYFPFKCGMPDDAPDFLRDTASKFPLEQSQGAFKGVRLFIIGNGPSLNKTDLRLLKSEYTVGLNRIYLNFDKMGFQPTFYCATNPLVLKQFGSDIDKIKSIKFVRKTFRNYLKSKHNTFFIRNNRGHGFSKDLRSGAWHEGWTVTFCAMQLAFYLGFDPVILIGVDHRYTMSGPPNKLDRSGKQDPNHFHKDYFSKGALWNYPDLVRSEASYIIARSVYANDSRMIVDATVDGKLQVFPKIDYMSLFTDNSPEIIEDKKIEFLRRATNDDQGNITAQAHRGKFHNKHIFRRVYFSVFNKIHEVGSLFK